MSPNREIGSLGDSISTSAFVCAFLLGPRRHPRAFLPSRRSAKCITRIDYRELGDYANNLIRSKARTIDRQGGFTSADRDDIEQELAIDLLKRLEELRSHQSGARPS